MATKYVMIQPDPFIGRTKELASYIPTYDAKGKLEKKSNPKNKLILDGIDEVSRPTQGFSAKPNTYAFVQVIKSTGEPVLVFNRPTPGSTQAADDALASKIYQEDGIDPDKAIDTSVPAAAVWTDWILQGVREQRFEKTQIVETFGDTYFYAFGEKPRSLVFTGILMNTADYNWKSVFWENWDRFFRASKLISMDARLYIGWDDIIVEGYPINAVVNQSADSPNALSFSFTFFVTNYINVTAQSGFRQALSASTGTVRRGYEDFSGRLGPSKMSLIDLLGARKPDVLAQASYELARSQRVSPEYAELLGKSIGQIAAAAEQNAYQRLTGDANSEAFRSAYTARSSLEFFQGAQRMFVDKLESNLGLRQGTLSLWFGRFTSFISDDVLSELGVENPANFKGKTLDRVLQGLAYNTATLKPFDKGKNLPEPKPGMVGSVQDS